MVLHTCERMAAGGMYDQLGGGFARYSVDAQWFVPHFEKMLYDNAQLVNFYLDAYLVSGNPAFARVVRRHSALCAPGYDASGRRLLLCRRCRQRRQRRQILLLDQSRVVPASDAEEFNVAVRYFGITERGNFVDHSDPHPLPNQNVLSIVEPNLPRSGQALLASSKQKMFEARSQASPAASRR